MKLDTPTAIILGGLIIAIGLIIAFSPESSPTSQEPEQNPEDISIENINEEDSVLGSREAQVKFIEFSDFDCPFCQRFHQTMHQLTDKYSSDEVAWVYRHFPLENSHPHAFDKAHGAECAAEQSNFWKMTDRLFQLSEEESQMGADIVFDLANELDLDEEQFGSCMEEETYAKKVRSDMQVGADAGATGTPYTVAIAENGFSENSIEQMRNMSAEFGFEELVFYSQTRDKIAFSGALPVEFLELIVDSTLEE